MKPTFCALKEYKIKVAVADEGKVPLTILEVQGILSILQSTRAWDVENGESQ